MQLAGRRPPTAWTVADQPSAIPRSTRDGTSLSAVGHWLTQLAQGVPHFPGLGGERHIKKGRRHGWWAVGRRDLAGPAGRGALGGRGVPAGSTWAWRAGRGGARGGAAAPLGGSGAA